MGNYVAVELTLVGDTDEVRRAREEIIAAHDDRDWVTCDCGNCWLWTRVGNFRGYSEMNECGGFFAYASHIAFEQDDVRRLSAQYPQFLFYVQEGIWSEAFYFVNGALLRQGDYNRDGADVEVCLHLLAEVKTYLGNPQPATAALVG